MHVGVSSESETRFGNDVRQLELCTHSWMCLWFWCGTGIFLCVLLVLLRVTQTIRPSERQQRQCVLDVLGLQFFCFAVEQRLFFCMWCRVFVTLKVCAALRIGKVSDESDECMYQFVFRHVHTSGVTVNGGRAIGCAYFFLIIYFHEAVLKCSAECSTFVSFQ